MKSLIYIFPLILVLFASCEQDLEVPFPPHEPKLVLNAYLHADKPFDVYITRSYGALEDVEVADILIPDATVEVYNGSDLLGTLNYRDTTMVDSFINKTYVLGKYHLDGLMVEAGKTYTIKASHSKYESVSATATIPAKPIVTKAEIVQDIYIYQYSVNGEVYGNGQSRIDVTVDDPAGPNYYDFEVAIELFDSTFNNLVYYQLDIQNNMVFDPEGGYYGDQLPMTDEDFDGGEGKMELLTWLPEEYGLLKDRKPLDIRKIYIQAISLSPDYYEFKRKFELQRENRGNDDLGIIPSEAIIIYSNVEGGYGIVAGFNEGVFEF
ncbi:MAG: DUF4249 domain-containing protein [Bacteroidia bacterium]